MLNPWGQALILASTLAVLTTTVPASAAAQPGGASLVTNQAARVTYVANEGFLIEIGGKKILIDALFFDPTIDWCRAPTAETARRMESAEAPFDGIDLILVTHWHVDHFTPELVLRHLASNPAAVLVAPPQATEKLRGQKAWSKVYESRVKEPDLELFAMVELTIHGIHVEAHQWRHSPYMLTDEETGKSYNKHEGVQNLTYLVDVGGIKFMHVGDAFFWDNIEYFDERYLPRQKVQLVFLLGWSEEHKEKLQHWLTPDYLVFMHLPAEPEEFERLSRYVADRLPNAVVFKDQMEPRCFHRSRSDGNADALSIIPCERSD